MNQDLMGFALASFLVSFLGMAGYVFLRPWTKLAVYVRRFVNALLCVSGFCFFASIFQAVFLVVILFCLAGLAVMFFVYIVDCYAEAEDC